MNFFTHFVLCCTDQVTSEKGFSEKNCADSAISTFFFKNWFYKKNYFAQKFYFLSLLQNSSPFDDNKASQKKSSVAIQILFSVSTKLQKILLKRNLKNADTNLD